MRYDMTKYLRKKILSEHGTMIQAGKTYKKTPCYMYDSAYRWFIVKEAKIF